ncbi:MAG: gliding motility lipoprotein GldH [Lentimicrobiaceae bacterium]|nr:gliding motility lipoprotein GldH [Lentimicrobiaceae bacterium]
MNAALKNQVCLSFALLLCLVFSCNHNTFYHKTYAIHNEIWNMDNDLVFDFTISDSLQYYNFYIDVRNTTNYPYQNLSLFFTTQFPDSTVFTDTLNCILSDAYGRWTGKGSGRIKENRFILKSKVRFPQKGNYIFTAQQAMRETDLKGIIDFGITLQYE